MPGVARKGQLLRRDDSNQWPASERQQPVIVVVILAKVALHRNAPDHIFALVNRDAAFADRLVEEDRRRVADKPSSTKASSPLGFVGEVVERGLVKENCRSRIRLPLHENLLEPPNHRRFVIGEPGSLPSPNTMPSAFHSKQLTAHTCSAKLVAKSFRLSKGHNSIIGAVNQQKRRRRRADIVDR